MPRKQAASLSITQATKRRISKLKGPRFGLSEDEIVRTLLALAKRQIFFSSDCFRVGAAGEDSQCSPASDSLGDDA